MKTPLLALTLCWALSATTLAAQGVPEPTPKPKPAKTASANSLAETVKKGRDPKKDKDEPKKSLGVITNETLKEPGKSPKKGTLNVAGSTTSKQEAERTEHAGAIEVKDDKGRTEADWRRMVTEARDRETKAKTDIARLEKETRRLENDFYAWSDGNYRDRMIKPAWDQSKEDLRHARQDLDAAQLAISELEEEARKSNTPPGWLRVR